MEQIGKWNEVDKQFTQLFATLISIGQNIQRYSVNNRMLLTVFLINSLDF